MAQQKVGSFQLNTTAGNQSITGLGFQPKAILFMHNPDTVGVNTAIANDYTTLGITDGVRQYAVWWFGPNGAGLESADHIQTDQFCIVGGQNASAIYGASIVSLDADGFTINVENPDVLPADTFMVGYMAFGGDDIEIKAGTLNLNTSTGSQAITGVGFQPSALIGFSVGSTQAFYTGGNANSDNITQPTMGFSDGTNNACVGGWLRDSGVTVSVRARGLRNDSWLASISGASTYNFRVAISSMDADGFTMNIADAGLAAKVFYLAIGGVGAKAGIFTHDVTLGEYTALSGLSFTPGALILATDTLNVANTINGGGGGGAQLFMAGMSDSLGNMFCVGDIDYDLKDTSSAWHWSHDEHLMLVYLEDGSTFMQADVASFGADSITINTVVGDTTDRLMPYLVLEGGAFDSGGGNTGTGSGGASSKDSSFFFLLV